MSDRWSEAGGEVYIGSIAGRADRQVFPDHKEQWKDLL
jgi:hypothetical protein